MYLIVPAVMLTMWIAIIIIFFSRKRKRGKVIEMKKPEMKVVRDVIETSR